MGEIKHGASKSHGTMPVYVQPGRTGQGKPDTAAAQARKASSEYGISQVKGKDGSETARVQQFIRTTKSLRPLPEGVIAQAMSQAVNDPKGAKEYFLEKSGLATYQPQGPGLSPETQGPEATPQKAAGIAKVERARREAANEAAKSGQSTVAKRTALVGEIAKLKETADKIDPSAASRLASFLEQAKTAASLDRLVIIAGIVDKISRDVAAKREPKLDASALVAEATAPASVEEPVKEEQTAAVETPPKEVAVLADRVTADTTGNAPDTEVKKDDPGAKTALADQAQMTVLDATKADLSQLPKKKCFGGCEDCGKNPRHLESNIAKVSDLTGQDKAKVLALALADKGKCEGSCTREGKTYKMSK